MSHCLAGVEVKEGDASSAVSRQTGLENQKNRRIGNAKLAAMTSQKGLKAHKTKTTYVIIGSNKYREDMKKEATKNPVLFGNIVCQPSESEIYLGEVIHSQGLEAGVIATIDNRMGKV